MFRGIVTLSFEVGPGPRVLSFRECEPCRAPPLGPVDGDRAAAAGWAFAIAGFELAVPAGEAGGPLAQAEMRGWDDCAEIAELGALIFCCVWIAGLLISEGGNKQCKSVIYHCSAR